MKPFPPVPHRLFSVSPRPLPPPGAPPLSASPSLSAGRTAALSLPADRPSPPPSPSRRTAPPPPRSSAPAAPPSLRAAGRSSPSGRGTCAAGPAAAAAGAPGRPDLSGRRRRPVPPLRAAAAGAPARSGVGLPAGSGLGLRLGAPLPSILASGFIEFKLDYEGTKSLAIGDRVHSDEISSGVHIWRILCYPHGVWNTNNGVYLSLFLELVSESEKVKAIFDAFLIGRDGAPSPSHNRRCVKVFDGTTNKACGFPQFVKRADLESTYIVDGRVTFMCGVIVLCDDDPISVPCSDIGDHLGRLLDGADGSDVSFTVGSEKFRAHRAVLAARSPVFKAQLLGSMAEAKMRCITLHGITPATFQILLRFMYTDAPPKDDELEASSSPVELLQHLLAAADMYQLDRLKLICTRKLWERVSAENVAAMLGCAETHSCPELKSRCLDFFVVEKNFRSAVLTEGYLRLMQSFPSVIDEIRARVQT